MLLEAVFTCLILLLLSYRQHRFNFAPFNWLSLLIASFAIEVVAAQLIKGQHYHLISSATPYIQVIIYGCLFGFVIKNARQYKTFVIVGLGFLLNAIVIFANNARMPVETAMALNRGFTASIKLLKDGLIFGHQPLTIATKLPLLADIISLAPPYPRPQTLSIGDIVIDIGLILLTVELIVKARKVQKNVD